MRASVTGARGYRRVDKIPARFLAKRIRLRTSHRIICWKATNISRFVKSRISWNGRLFNELSVCFSERTNVPREYAQRIFFFFFLQRALNNLVTSTF